MAEIQELSLDKQHLYVKADLNEKRPFCYSSIWDALDVIPDGTREAPSVIYLAPDVYWTGGTASSVGLVINKNWLTLCGMGNSPGDVVIADNRGHMINAWPADGSSSSPAHTMVVNGDGFRAENLTIGNYLNIDLEYPRDSSKNKKKYCETITQAYALGSQGRYDCWSLEHCRIVGMLDTLSFHHERVYFHQCLIQGTNDFIGGGNQVVYEDCDFIVYASCPMYRAGETATLFKNCRFQIKTEKEEVLYMTKFGGQVVLDCCSFEGNIRRLEWKLETETDDRCYSRNLTLNGDSVWVSAETPYNSIEITSENEDSLSVYNMLQGDDGWNPGRKEKTDVFPIQICLQALKKVREEEKTAEAPIFRHCSGQIEVLPKISIAYGEKISVKPVILPEIAAAACLEQELKVTANGPVKWEWENGILYLTGVNDSVNRETASVIVSHKGVQGVCTVYCEPKEWKQPDWNQFPKLNIENQMLLLEYELKKPDMENNNPFYDTSNIVWKRKKDGRILAVSREIPCRQYRLRSADIGSQIEVTITPRCNGMNLSDSSKDVVCVSRTIKAEDIIDPHIIWDSLCFFPTQIQPKNTGDFYIETYRPLYCGEEVPHVAEWLAQDAKDAWVYGRGRNASRNFWGLVTCARGASLQYRKGNYWGGMEVFAELCPDKENGDGFGSANGQFIEILIKYNAETRSGYGLRIERVPKRANGCNFSLRQYENGINHCMSNPIFSGAFITPCQVNLKAEGGVLKADIITKSEKRQLLGEQEDNLYEVHMCVDYKENGFGDFEIHHTGTVPIGNRTLISQLKIQYHKI